MNSTVENDKAQRTYPVAFGKFLKELRKQHGMTQRDLGETLTRNLNYISRLENCNQRPQPFDLERISKKFDIPFEDLKRYLNGSEKEHVGSKESKAIATQDRVKGFPTAGWMWNHTLQHTEADVLRDLQKKLNRIRGSYANRVTLCYQTWGPGVKESVMTFLQTLSYVVKDYPAERCLTLTWQPLKTEGLNDYVVKYREGGETSYFICAAESCEHAQEQFESEYPEASSSIIRIGLIVWDKS